MARELTANGTAASNGIGDADARVSRSVARALAAAVASLLVTTLVVQRTTNAIQNDGTAAAADISAATISLSDDDDGRSLVALGDMTPSRPLIECIAVTYKGNALPAALSLSAEVTGELASYLQVTVERGTGGAFGKCDNFVPTADVFSGSLLELSADPVKAGTFVMDGATDVFRFRFDLQDDAAAIGKTASADIVWEAVPT